MALPKEVYQALEDIVGHDNISQEPAILDSYAFQYAAEVNRDGSKFYIRPVAALLPGSTEEVQAIVRTCNKYKVRFKAYSTGWFPPAAPQTEGVIQLDLRRMSRILEIDEKNMFAVIEPYVIGATLQAEAMKVGLNCHIIGAGSGCSPLASATSMGGPGPDSLFMGHSSENLLALEWVMPNGEILRTGSLGSGIGWFCGEGPGPSLRGVVRGTHGWRGGAGVFTKVAVRLSPWPGPAVMPVEGVVPAYYSPLPENFRTYTLAFPTWEAYAEAYYCFYNAEIAYIAHRQFNMFGEELQAAMVKIISDHKKSMDDLDEMLKKPAIKKLTEQMRRSFQVVLVGQTPREIGYQEKVLKEILAKTGGINVAEMAEPDMQKYVLLYLLKLCYKQLNFVYAGGYFSTFTQCGTPDFISLTLQPMAAEMMSKHTPKGLVIDGGPDAMMAALSYLGGGGHCAFEQFLFYDPYDKKSVKGAGDFAEDAAKTAIGKGFEPGMETCFSDRARKAAKDAKAKGYWGLPAGWQTNIQDAIDPNKVGDFVAGW